MRKILWDARLIEGERLREASLVEEETVTNEFDRGRDCDKQI